MTYNPLVKNLRTLLESHLQIKSVKFATPKDWLYRDEQPEFPICCYAINNGSLNAGREQVYSVSFWFLDKAGMEALYETEVISDQMQIAADIVSELRSNNTYLIDTNITFEAILDKFEDYLAGVTLTFNISTISSYDACDAPFA